MRDAPLPDFKGADDRSSWERSKGFPQHLSYSQISTLRRCGEAYRLSKVWNVPQRQGWASIGGTAVHHWTEDWDMHQLGGNPVKPFEWYLECATVDAEQRYDQDRSEFKASGRASRANPNKEDRKWWLENGPLMCQRWVNWRHSTPLDIWISETGEAGIELKFDIELGGVRYVGSIDRAFIDHRTGLIIIVDIKTGSKKVLDDAQVGPYKIALETRFPEEAGRVQYGAIWHARDGGTGPLMPLNEWTRERADWEVGQADERRKRGDYQPNQGDHCSWCYVADYCIYQNGPKSGEVRPAWVSIEEWEEGEAA